MNRFASPRASLTLFLAAAAPTAGCIQLTDFEDLTEGSSSDGSADSTGGASATTTATTTATATSATTTTTTTTTSASSLSATDDTTVGSTDVTVGATQGETDATSESESVGTSEGADTETEPLPDCPGVNIGAASLGEGCADNLDCTSGLCTIFTDAPLNADSSCVVPQADCSMRITGTSLDLVTGQPLPGVELRIVTAVSAATDPVGAMAMVAGISDGAGRLDVLTPGEVNDSFGLVALLEAPGYHLTGTPTVEPLEGSTEYGVGNDVHDLWLVSDVALAAWSNMLALDPTIPPAELPLGVAGGAVGRVRDAAGLPVSGATVTPTNGASDALVRYLNDDGTFGATATGSLGLFVILDPNLAESFEATLDGMSLGTAITTSAPGAVFTLAYTAP
jgi:hypothetical protein